MTIAIVVAAAVALVVSSPRWLRIAQREHYLPGSCIRFAMRWWRSSPANLALAGLAVAGEVVAVWWAPAAFVTVAVVIVGPLHLSLRGRTSPLVWTRRLRTLAAVWALLAALLIAFGAVFGLAAHVAAVVALISPLIGDDAMAILQPVERRLGSKYVRVATERLRQVSPQVVAITGSYGKTSTKNHVAQLIEGTKSVVATPASFNNRAGLARAVNEHLVAGTEVFIAEMGTYGPHEIADMCRWCPPDIAVITAIGPVHLERFGTEDRIVTAKAEITERATVVVLNVDDRRLAKLADSLHVTKTVVRCSALDDGADVCVRRDESSQVSVTLGGRRVADGVALDPALQAGNVACAVAVALRVGVPEDHVVDRLRTLRGVPNRLSAARAPSGVWVIDDTFNSNPAGARAALHELAAVPGASRRALVTPGMVELGPMQREENERLAQVASAIATDLVVVGQTNREALLDGAQRLSPVTVRTREEAVDWVRAKLGEGDAVLYENDLPDHYP
jgi:UDP-N-acetylmuramoyl-tripeptide--D-alanyl-D-alanine ligase